MPMQLILCNNKERNQKRLKGVRAESVLWVIFQYVGNLISNYAQFFQISNFGYLMELNTLAGRSYNDSTQVSILHTLYFLPNLMTCHSNICSCLCSTLFFPG